MVADTAYFQFPDSTVVVCMATLANGTRSVGVAHGPADAANFDYEEAAGHARQDALNKALPFVVFLHREPAMQAKMDADLQGRMAIDLSGMSLSDAEVADLAAMMKSPDSRSIIQRADTSYPGARAEVGGEHPHGFKVGQSVMHRRFLHGFMTVIGWDGMGNVLCKFLDAGGESRRWFVAGDIIPAVKEPEQVPSLVPGDVVRDANPANSAFNVHMTVEAVSAGGWVRCVWFDDNVVVRRWFEQKWLEKVDLGEAEPAPAAPGASEHYTSPRGFTATIGPVQRDDSASGCGMCGGCGCK